MGDVYIVALLFENFALQRRTLILCVIYCRCLEVVDVTIHVAYMHCCLQLTFDQTKGYDQYIFLIF